MTYLKDVSTLRLIPENCTGCDRCIEVCPREVLRAERGKVAVADRDACIECGACMMNCAFNAIKVEAGVGCAAAFINGMIHNSAPECGCGGGNCCG